MMTWMEKSTNTLPKDKGAQTGTTCTHDGNPNVSGEREEGHTENVKTYTGADCTGAEN